MSINETILNQTFNRFKVTGYVSEMGMLEQQSDGKWKNVPLRITKTKREKYVDGKPSGVQIDCERLRGSILLQTTKGIQEFSINFYSVKSDGEPNTKMWEMAKKILDWIPAINPPKDKANEAPSYVTMQGDVSIYDKADKDGKVYTKLQWNGKSRCQHAKEDEKSGCSLAGVAYLNSWRKETVPVGDEFQETGRLIVELYGANNRGECFPITCYVEADMADAFEDCFEKSQTLDCEFNRVVRKVGNEIPKKRAFGGGKSDVNVSEGYSKEEIILVGADIIEEPDELTIEDENGNEKLVKTKWINPEAMKKAINARNQMLEELKNDVGKKKSAPVKSKEDVIRENLNNAKFGKKSDVNIDDEFDDDDDLF